MNDNVSVLRGIISDFFGVIALSACIIAVVFLVRLVNNENAQPVHVTVIVDNEVVLDYDGTKGSYYEMQAGFIPHGTGRYCFEVGNKKYYFDNPQLIVEALEE